MKICLERCRWHHRPRFDGANVENQAMCPAMINICSSLVWTASEALIVGHRPQIHASIIEASPELFTSVTPFHGVFSARMTAIVSSDLNAGLYDHDWFIGGADYDAYGPKLSGRLTGFVGDEEAWYSRTIPQYRACRLFSSGSHDTPDAKEIWKSRP